MSLMTLPTHLLEEIISHLPMKALSSCKLVCKQLLNLVSDPKFSDLYLYKSRPHLLYRYSDDLYLFDLEGEEAPAHLRATTLWSRQKCNNYLVSSCNGLICSSTRRGEVTVCNPILRNNITLPKLTNCFQINLLASGFAANKHYKVLCVISHNITRCDFEARIYIIGGTTSTWRSIGQAPFYSFLHLSQCMDTFVNGVVHWFDVVRWETPLIHAFDFDTEQFSVIPTPEKMGMDFDCVIQVGVVKECLAVSGINNSLQDRFDVWVMKEYGVNGSWTKLYSVAFMRCDPPERLIRPVKTLAGGEALMMCEVCFVSYEIKSMPSHILEAFPELHRRNLHVCAVVLTPSLVSLKQVANQEDVENLV